MNNRKFKKDEIESMEDLAKSLLPLTDIAKYFEMDIDELKILLMDSSHIMTIAYNRGIILQKKEIHDSVIKQAKRGSSQAQSIAKILLDNLKK